MDARALTTWEVRAALDAGLAYVPSLLLGKPDEILRHHVAEGEWCAKQVLGHLIEAEGEVFGALIPGMLDRDPPAGWDRAPRMVREECDDDPEKLLTRWISLRRKGLEIVADLRESDLGRTSEKNWHGGPRESVGDLVRHWPEHTAEHVAQLIRAIRAGRAALRQVEAGPV